MAGNGGIIGPPNTVQAAQCLSAKKTTFTSSGTFTAQATANVDYLVVGGGGAGGGDAGGGGGAGGYRASGCFTPSPTRGSAVNHIDVTNAATGSGPQIGAVGDDTNISLKLRPKATGNIEVMGATNPGSIQLNCESNSHGIKLTSPPHSSAQSYEMKFPTSNITAGTFLKVDSITGSGTTAVGQLTFDSSPATTGKAIAMAIVFG